MGQISCPDTSVRNYHYSLRNNPEERSSWIVSRHPTVLSRARSVVQLNTIMPAISVEVRSMLHCIKRFIFSITNLAVSLCRLQELKLAGLSPRRPGFDPRPVNVGFMSDKVALGQVFLRIILFSPRHCPSASVPYTFIHLSPTLATDSIYVGHFTSSAHCMFSL
jgi:hypothetical protein